MADIVFLLAVFNACTIITRFTRIVGELFGVLIAVLLIQEAIKGMVNEFSVSKSENPNEERYQFQCVAVYKWTVGTNLHLWTSLYFFKKQEGQVLALWHIIPSKVSYGVPRRLYTPLPWKSASLYHWTVIKDMGKVPPAYIFAAIIPDIMIRSSTNDYESNGENKSFQGSVQASASSDSLRLEILNDSNKNALEDPFVFTANANEASSILTTVGDDEYWNGEAQERRSLSYVNQGHNTWMLYLISFMKYWLSSSSLKDLIDLLLIVLV
ncbi:hypothetical protein C5167_039994 [Papaver somniferum]|uniref:Uncharacterized protein n=1 Tax=Papaver somniferum TaxID=3469 RepID=A0A4Y7IHZ4_PAPSO|nr:hypothetical protein C5167_039994 [Papaver somniferum]